MLAKIRLLHRRYRPSILLKRSVGLSSSQSCQWLTHRASSDDTHRHNHHHIRIGNISVPQHMTPQGSNSPHLIPQCPFQEDPFASSSSSLSSSILTDLRWILQKDLLLKQDFIVLSSPTYARDRRHLLSLYAYLTSREVEYMSLSKDTSEADLTQRKEVQVRQVVPGGEIQAQQQEHPTTTTTTTSVFVNQAPVRAALHGRLLILDGLEKAERNVLPTLNNLLENREMSLEDGSRLVSSNVYDDVCKMVVQQEGGENGGEHQYHQNNPTTNKIHRVHPDFRVAALTSITPDSGNPPLDPPLRSRFQARITPHSPSPSDLLSVLVNHLHLVSNNKERYSDDTSSGRSTSMDMIQDIVHIISQEELSLQSAQDAVRYLTMQNHVSVPSVMDAHGLGLMGAEDFGFPREEKYHPLESTNNTPMATDAGDATKEEGKKSSSSTFVQTTSTQTLRDMIHSAFQSGKRAVACVGPKGCRKSALARDTANSLSLNEYETAAATEATPTPTQPLLFSLHRDMSSRDLLQVRGTDAMGNTLWRMTPLTRAIQNGSWVILDGIDKLATDTLTSLALLMEQGQVDLPDGTRLYAKDAAGGAGGFRCIALAHSPTGGGEGSSSSWMTPEVRSMFFWIQVDAYPKEELIEILSNLYPLMDPAAVEKIVNLGDLLQHAIQSGAADTLKEKESLALSLRTMKHICRRAERRDICHLPKLVQSALLTSFMPDRERRIVEKCMVQCNLMSREEEKDHQKNYDQSTLLDPELIKSCRRSPTNPLLVPNPRFEENQGHSQVMQDILDAFSVGERALLIMGYQGVGKNKVVDYLLSLLQCEREYLQLHRDTSVQSLLSSPSVENGRIVYRDSALVRAAKYGRILVLDEADKAPVEVVASLKCLIEDGELALPDGRVLRYESDNIVADEDDIIIHEDFRVWALANPAGYPFHGNDLAREMADVFSCHVVPPLDPRSHEKILQSYGSNVPEKTIKTIINIWTDLSKEHQNGTIVYPFSVRESVSVVKHLNEFPGDGLDDAIENVIAFDRFENAILQQLNDIFECHGVSVFQFRRDNITEKERLDGGISTPKTRASGPKHGKVDPDNTPHVGGNTWHGGTGGSDTAGLGGRGGPYRVDAGHPVHQVSDEMKADVSKEVQRRARKMAKEALEKKLKDLKMNELDWERYNSLRQRVAVPIQQLVFHLRDIEKRNDERVWLKRQSTGELDEARLVDALAGEKDVFKRRGIPEHNGNPSSFPSDLLRVKLVVDISASMYRFNGFDSRLERLLEACLMIMETLRDDSRFQLTIVGHNGTSAMIPLVDASTPLDESTQLKVLEGMVAHTQYTYAGDRTLEAIESAVSNAKAGDLVLIISDANLKRYRIEPYQISSKLGRTDVHSHMILIGSMGEEAKNLAKAIPNERAQVCLDTSELPGMIKTIVVGAVE